MAKKSLFKLIEKAEREYIGKEIDVVFKTLSGGEKIETYELIGVIRKGESEIYPPNQSPDRDITNRAFAKLKNKSTKKELEVFPLGLIIDRIDSDEPVYRNYFDN